MNFEQILIKNLMTDKDFFVQVMPILKSKYFSDQNRKEIFKCIRDFNAKYSNVPNLTDLITEIKNIPSQELRKGMAENLLEIDKIQPPNSYESAKDETVNFVRHCIFTEALIIGSDAVQKNDEKLVNKSKQLMEEMSKVALNKPLGIEFNDIDDRIALYSERYQGILTSHKSINKRLGDGFKNGTLNLLLAPAGIGKSLMKTDIIAGLLTQGKNVLLISLEMKDIELMKRIDANVFKIPINSISDLNKTEAEKNQIRLYREVLEAEDIKLAYEQLKMRSPIGKLHIVDFPPNSVSPLMVENLVKEFEAKFGIKFDMVAIDYLGIMKSDLLSPSAGLYSYVKSIGEEVRAVAKKLDVPVLSSSQLNRSAFTNVDAADNSSVSDSIGTAQTADFMMFLLQTPQMKEIGEMLLKVTKNRYTGMTDAWKIGIDYNTMSFYDLPDQDTIPTQKEKDYTQESLITHFQNDDKVIKAHDKKNVRPEDAENIEKGITSDDVMSILGIK